MKPRRDLVATLVASAVSSSLALAAESTCMKAPERMMLSPSMKAADLGKAKVRFLALCDEQSLSMKWLT